MTKPIEISKKLVYEAWLKVEKNQGAHGVDKLTIDEIKQKAKKKIRHAIRELKIPKLTGLRIEDIRDLVNPKLRGWNAYYGRFRKWDLYEIFEGLDGKIVKWYGKKYKVGSKRAVWKWLEDLKTTSHAMFEHWVFLNGKPA